MKETYLVYVTIHGDDWSNDETHIVHTKKDVEYYHSKAYEDKQLEVSGIEWIEVSSTDNLTMEKVFDLLTLDDVFDIYPELKPIVTDYFVNRAVKS